MSKLRNLLTALLALALSLALGSVHAEVRLPQGQYTETNADLRVKLMGGFVEANRTWFNDKWFFNPDWDALKFTFDSLDASVASISRGDAEYKLTSPGVFVQDKRNTIRSTATGYRWQDRQGNWIDYDTEGKILKRGDRNDVKLSFKYDTSKKLVGVLDHFDTQVLTFEYTGNLLTAVRDYTNRRVQYQYTGSNLTKIIDVLGNAWVYTYDGANKLLTKTDPENRKTSITYNPNGRVATIKDADNIGPAYAYDYDKSKSEFYVKETSPTGKVTETRYNEAGQTIRQDINGKTVSTLLVDGRNYTTKDQRGLSTTNEYDEWDNIIKMTNSDGTTIINKYDPTYSNLLETTNEIGVTSRLTYDTKGNLTRLTEVAGQPGQRVSEYAYDEYGNRLTAKRLSDVVTQAAMLAYTYDSYGNVITITDAEGHKSTLTYDVLGNVLVAVDARNKSWPYGYDATGRLLFKDDPLNYRTQYSYDKIGRKVKGTDARNNSTNYFYNVRNDLIRVTNAEGVVSQYEYDVMHRLVKQVDGEGKGISHEYDVDGHLAKQTDSGGNVTTYIYGDAAAGTDGLAVKTIYPTYQQEFKYDQRNRVVEIIDIADGGVSTSTKLVYDSVGNRSQVIDAEGRITKYFYDAYDRLIKIVDAANGVTEYIYDNRDNVISVKDPSGNVTKYEHDRNNRNVKEVRPRGQVTTYTYDEAGSMVTRVDAKGQVRKYIYDDSRRFVREDHYLNSASVTASKTITYTYNELNQLTSYADGFLSGSLVYDVANRKATETVDFGAFSLAVSHTYYLNGRAKSLTGPDRITYGYTYNKNNQLQAIQLLGGQITINDYQWFAPARITFPGGTVRDQTHDSLMRLKAINVKSPSQNELLGYQYGYDKIGNILTKKTNHGGYQYTYDALDRLVQSTNPTLPAEKYTYDAVGNRLTDSQVAGTWSYDANNQLNAYGNVTLEYDANGNTVKKTENGQVMQYVYDVADRVTKVTDGAAATIAKYAYDPLGRRVMKEVAGVKTYFLYTDEGLIGEFDEAGNQLVGYGFAPGSDWTSAPLFQKTSAGYFFYQNDYIGTPQVMVDTSGAIVWSAKSTSFGNAYVDASSTLTNNLRMPGQYYDRETGTHYNYWRSYDPLMGRYIQPDPILLAGGINLYAYVEGNPNSFIDPLGLRGGRPIDQCKGAKAFKNNGHEIPDCRAVPLGSGSDVDTIVGPKTPIGPQIPIGLKTKNPSPSTGFGPEYDSRTGVRPKPEFLTFDWYLVMLGYFEQTTTVKTTPYECWIWYCSAVVGCDPRPLSYTTGPFKLTGETLTQVTTEKFSDTEEIYLGRLPFDHFFPPNIRNLPKLGQGR